MLNSRSGQTEILSPKNFDLLPRNIFVSRPGSTNDIFVPLRHPDIDTGEPFIPIWTHFEYLLKRLSNLSTIDDALLGDFAEKNFQPIENIPNIPQLQPINTTNTSHFTFLDSEGLDYQTEQGENYDTVSSLPHVIIAENVFLVVRDRLNPQEIIGKVQNICKGFVHFFS